MNTNYEKIGCAICGEKIHFIEAHLRANHNEIDLTNYKKDYPSAPLFSDAAKAKLKFALSQVSKEKIDFDVKKTFGVNVKDTIKTVRGFATPRKTTPEVDPYYVFDTKTLVIGLYSIMNKFENVLFSGATGAGKSSVIEQFAARLNWGYYRINFDGDITRSDIIGQWVLKGDKMIFQYGILPKAMLEGSILCLDEWDCINPSVGMILQPVLEGKSLIIPETGEVIKPHDDFKIFATSNTIGQGDTTGLYNGTQPQNFAQLDRFSLVGIVEYPTKTIETKILKLKAGITDSAISDKILEVAKIIRRSFIKGETMATMSTRTIVNIGKKLMDFGSEKIAFELAFLNKLNQDDKNFCGEIIQRVYGSEAVVATEEEYSVAV